MQKQTSLNKNTSANLLAISPMAWYAFCFSYALGIASHNHLYASAFCLFLLFLFILQKQGTRLLLLLLSLIFYAFAFFYTHSLFSNDYTFELNPYIEESYTAHIDKVQSLQDQRLRLIVSDVNNTHNSQTLKKKAVLYIQLNKEIDKDFSMPLEGMQISFTTRVRPISFPKNTGINDASLYWHSMGVYYSAYINTKQKPISLHGKASVLARLRQELYEGFISLCKKGNNEIVTQAEAILIALIFGEKFYIDTQSYQLFIQASLVHSIALSGMHLAFALILAYILVKVFTFFRPQILLRFPLKILLGFVSIPLSLLYLWLGNAPISLLRATIMLTIFWLFIFFYKRIKLLDCLALCVSIILIFMPESIIHLGFQFSVLCILAIALFAPYFTAFTKYFFSSKTAFYDERISFIKKAIFYLSSLLYISFIIQVFLLPLQLSAFGLISPYFILNLIWLPLLQLLILPLAFLSLFTLHFPQVSDIFLTLASSLTSAFLDFLSFLNSYDLLEQIQFYRFDIWQSIGYYLLLISLLYYRKLKSPFLFLFLSLTCLVAQPLYSIYDNLQAQKEERIIFRVISVGQGQSILIEYADKRFLIDAGGVFGNRFDTGRDTIAKLLTYQNFPKIDATFITHFDLDHAKGFFHLVKHFDFPKLYYSGIDNKKNIRPQLLELAKQRQIETQALFAFDEVELVKDILSFQVLSPYKETYFNKANFSNNSSLVLRLMHKDKGIALICGDIEQEAITELLKNKDNLQSKLLVLPHHGAESSYNEEFYNRVSPQIVVASTGLYNKFGFPSQRIAHYFSNKGITIRNTAFEDELIFKFSK